MDTTQHTPADVRERVAKIVREAMEDARRSERLNTFLLSSMWDYTDRILALLRTPRGEGEALAVEVIRLNTALALLKTEENAAHVEAVATNAAWLEELERIAAFATRTPAAPALGWSEVRERANMLRAVLREHGFEHLRSALVGQRSDAVFYGQWERHKALLRDLLDALDAALRSEAQGEAEPMAWRVEYRRKLES